MIFETHALDVKCVSAAPLPLWAADGTYLFQMVWIADGQIFERGLADEFDLFGENFYAARVSGYLAGRAA